jgi:hypothetical protein
MKPSPTAESGINLNNLIMNIHSLKIGDLIVRQKGPFSTHFIVYVGIHNGIQMVAENQNGIGVRFISLTDALAGNVIKRFENFGGTEEQRALVIPRIKELLGTSYNLVVFNCEHFARWISNGKIESKQVKIASNIALAGGAAMLTSNNNGVKVLGALSILAGLFGHASQR